MDVKVGSIARYWHAVGMLPFSISFPSLWWASTASAVLEVAEKVRERALQGYKVLLFLAFYRPRCSRLQTTVFVYRSSIMYVTV